MGCYFTKEAAAPDDYQTALRSYICMMMYQICEYIGCSAGFEFNASESVTSALSTQIIHNFDPTVSADHQDKVNVIALQQQQAPLVSKLPANLPQILNLSSEKGASLWLSALPKLKAFY